ncbi:MAG: cation transporter [Candidatus Marinimicrobia bacterium]|nr:cation transporter [Candidatus Neomarinimicrobiota bacterium]
MNKTTIKVKGMSCGHCKMTVENALKENKCVTDASVNLDKGEANVEYKDCLESVDTLKEAIKNAGYEAI